MFFAVLYIFVICFNVLDCRNLINLNLTKKEAHFILKALNKSIQTVPREQHGEDYQSGNTEATVATVCRDVPDYKTKCPQWKQKHTCSLVRIPGWSDSIASLCKKTCGLCPGTVYKI